MIRLVWLRGRNGSGPTAPAGLPGRRSSSPGTTTRFEGVPFAGRTDPLILADIGASGRTLTAVETTRWQVRAR
jgi:hypothetical protein